MAECQSTVFASYHELIYPINDLLFLSINIEGTFVFAKYLPKQPKSTSNFVGKGATSTLKTVDVVVEWGGRCKKFVL